MTCIPTATTRFREYFPPGTAELIRPATGEATNAPFTPVEVLNSARPDAPKILYVIPTFRWTKKPPSPSGSGERVVHIRQGNGLRVYVDRPWFSTGWDERLAVVIRDDGQTFATLPEKLVPLVTQWGRDPIWTSPAPERLASASTSPAFSRRSTGVVIATLSEEQPGEAVSAIPYAVEFDSTRSLWFADIEMKLGESYNPFVRLALARFQFHSLPGAELFPRVARADFIQLPDREASVTFLPSPQPTTIDVKLTGTAHASAPLHLSSVVELGLELRRDDLTGDRLGAARPAPVQRHGGRQFRSRNRLLAKVILKKQAVGTAPPRHPRIWALLDRHSHRRAQSSP